MDVQNNREIAGDPIAQLEKDAVRKKVCNESVLMKPVLLAIPPNT